MCYLTLQEKLAGLAAEYDSRVAVAAFHARCEAEAAHQGQLLALRQQLAGLQAECEQLRARLEGAPAEQARAVEAAVAQQRAHAGAAAAALRQAHDEQLVAVRAEAEALLGEREREHAALLAELRALKSASSSAAPSRAGGDSDQHLVSGGAPAHRGPLQHGGWRSGANPGGSSPLEESSQGWGAAPAGPLPRGRLPPHPAAAGCWLVEPDDD